MNKVKPSASIYARCSTDESKQDVEVQLKELRRYCEAYGWLNLIPLTVPIRVGVFPGFIDNLEDNLIPINELAEKLKTSLPDLYRKVKKHCWRNTKIGKTCYIYKTDCL